MGKLHAASTSEKWLGVGQGVLRRKVSSVQRREHVGCGEEEGEWRAQLRQAGRTHTGEANQESSARWGWGGRYKNQKKNKGGSGKAAAPEPCWKKNPWTDLR